MLCAYIHEGAVERVTDTSFIPITATGGGKTV